MTGDKRVLPYLQELHDELVNGLYDDYTGGHFYRGGDYRSSGFNFGTTNVAIALALCTKTPIKVRHDILRRVLRVLESCTTEEGEIHYGRASQPAKQLDTFSRTGMTSLALEIAGGSKDYLDRLHICVRSENYNRLDHGHTCKVLAIYWSSLSAWMYSPDEFKKLMAQWRWYYNSHRLAGGGFALTASERFTYHQGDFALGHVMTTALLTQVLAAPRRNILLTGRKHGEEARLVNDVPTVKYEDLRYQKELRDKLAIMVETLRYRAIEVPPLLQSVFEQINRIDAFDPACRTRAEAIWKRREGEIYDALKTGISDPEISRDLRAFMMGAKCYLSFMDLAVEDGKLRVIASQPKEADIKELRLFFGDRSVALPKPNKTKKLYGWGTANWASAQWDLTLEAPVRTWTKPIVCQATFGVMGEELVRRWTIPQRDSRKFERFEWRPGIIRWREIRNGEQRPCHDYMSLNGFIGMGYFNNYPIDKLPVAAVLTAANVRFPQIRPVETNNNGTLRLRLQHTGVEMDVMMLWSDKLPLKIGERMEISLSRFVHAHKGGSSRVHCGRFLQLNEDGTPCNTR
jgi:hypothetical protein